MRDNGLPLTVVDESTSSPIIDAAPTRSVPANSSNGNSNGTSNKNHRAPPSRRLSLSSNGSCRKSRFSNQELRIDHRDVDDISVLRDDESTSEPRAFGVPQNFRASRLAWITIAILAFTTAHKSLGVSYLPDIPNTETTNSADRFYRNEEDPSFRTDFYSSAKEGGRRKAISSPTESNATDLSSIIMKLIHSESTTEEDLVAAFNSTHTPTTTEATTTDKDQQSPTESKAKVAKEMARESQGFRSNLRPHENDGKEQSREEQ